MTRISFASWRSIPGAVLRFRRLRRIGRRMVPGLVDAHLQVRGNATLLFFSLWRDELALVQFTTLEAHVDTVRWTIRKRGKVWSGVFRRGDVVDERAVTRNDPALAAARSLHCGAHGRRRVVSCPATPFSGERPPDPNTASFSRWWYHGDGIWVALAPPYEGRWYAGEPALKVLWYSEVAGELRITGTRLDAPGAVLSAEVPSGYQHLGYQPSSILVPEPGCWEITGSVGEQTLRVVADVLAPELHPLRGRSSARLSDCRRRGLECP